MFPGGWRPEPFVPMHILVALFVALLAALPASAQIAPTEAELRAYGGLHAAAARGDVADMENRPLRHHHHCGGRQ